jgi:hypothetical protein
MFKYVYDLGSLFISETNHILWTHQNNSVYTCKSYEHTKSEIKMAVPRSCFPSFLCMNFCKVRFQKVL